MVVRIEEGGGEVPGGHWCAFKFTKSCLVESFGEVLVDDVGNLPAVVSVQHHVPCQVLSTSTTPVFLLPLAARLTSRPRRCRSPRSRGATRPCTGTICCSGR